MAHSAYSINKAYSTHLNEAYFAYLEKIAYLEQIPKAKYGLLGIFRKYDLYGSDLNQPSMVSKKI